MKYKNFTAKYGRILKIAFGLLALYAAFKLFWLEQLDDIDRKNQRQVTILEKPQHPGQIKSNEVKIPKNPVEIPIPDLFLNSKKWLDEVCPPLSEAEENQLLEKNARSKETFIGLILLNSKRRTLLLREAFTLYPDDPSVLRLLLSESDSPHDRKTLDFSSDELISSARKLHALEPDDIEIAMSLAAHELESGNLAAATEVLKAMSTEKDIGASDKIKNYEIKTNLLEQAGREKESASVRALASPDGVITSNSFTRQAYDIMFKKKWSSEEEAFVRFAIDNSQRELPISSQTAETHAVALSNESLWAGAIQDQRPMDSTFYGRPIADVRAEILKEYREATVYRSMSTAIVPLMQQLNPEERGQFTQTLMGSGEMAALKYIQEIRPTYSDTTVQQVSDWKSNGTPIPTSRFW